MTLQELFRSVPWSMVETAMSGHYDVKTENCLNDHKQVYDRALVMEPVASRMIIVLKKRVEDGENYVDLTGEDGTKNRDMPDFKYMNISDNDHRAEELVGFALEFEPWQKWVGMTVHPDTLAEFPPEDIVAHCLWEMAFIGFDEPKIQAEHEKLDKIAEDIKAGRAKLSGPFNSAKEMFDHIMSRKDKAHEEDDIEEKPRDDGQVDEELGQGQGRKTD